MHPAFNPGGTAAIVEHAEGPVAFDAAPIVYSEEDERAIETYARATSALPYLSPSSRAMIDSWSLSATPSEHDLACGEFSLVLLLLYVMYWDG
jgi:hypothetical protein